MIDKLKIKKNVKLKIMFQIKNSLKITFLKIDDFLQEICNYINQKL